MVKLPDDPSPVPDGMSAKRGNFDLRRLEAEHLDSFANDRMLDFVDSIDMLKMGIFQIDSLGERSHHVDVDVLVDGARDQEAAVLAIIGRQIGAAAAEADAERATRCDHIRTSCRFFR